MLTFRHYISDRRYMTSNLCHDAWIFVIFALGDPRYLDVRSWTDLRALIEQDGLSPQLQRGAFRAWRSYLTWRRRKRVDGLAFAA
jgi:hypothetical protein